jgi:hypothetical protein
MERTTTCLHPSFCVKRSAGEIAEPDMSSTHVDRKKNTKNAKGHRNYKTVNSAHVWIRTRQSVKWTWDHSSSVDNRWAMKNDRERCAGKEQKSGRMCGEGRKTMSEVPGRRNHSEQLETRVGRTRAGCAWGGRGWPGAKWGCEGQTGVTWCARACVGPVETAYRVGWGRVGG